MPTTDAARFFSLSSGSIISSKSEGHFHGWNQQGWLDLHTMERLLVFPGAGVGEHRVAVGAVMESGSDPETTDEGFPVVLAVDMNHGWTNQRSASQALRNHNTDSIWIRQPLGLRGQLEGIVDRLKSQNLGSRDLHPRRYHLVSAGFFPWLTPLPWAKCTGSTLGEELLLRYFGWPNPLEMVAALIELLHKECRNLDSRYGLTHIIFHGTDGVAMRGGMAVTGQLTREHTPPSFDKIPLYRATQPLSDFRSSSPRNQRRAPDVILCDDLSTPQASIEIDHAVWLGQMNLNPDQSDVMELDH